MVAAVEHNQQPSIFALDVERAPLTPLPLPGSFRVKFDQWLRALDKNHVMPDLEEGETIFEYYVNLTTFEWEK